MEREDGEEGSSSSSSAAAAAWSCATNWTVAPVGSSLESSISFDTSEEDAPELTSPGALLLRPSSSADPPPCEVTLFFRGKHEIHTVYARTTARIFEIYCTKSADASSSTREYLCTVKCSPVEEAPHASSTSQNSSVHSSEEETWVDVKPPSGSPLGDAQPVHYEARAEISDIEPCASLTLRFLSLQTKSSVHVEEIYIYCDPVDESCVAQDSLSSTTGYSNASSLFAMLVPNLLQMPMSGLSSRINERYFSPDRIHDRRDVEDRNAKLDFFVTEEIRKQAVDRREENNNYQTQKEGMLNQVKIPVATDTTVPSPVQSYSSTSPYQSQGSHSSAAAADQEAAFNADPVKVGPKSDVGKSVTDGSINRVEKILEHLVSKVEKIETYFMKFEEKMVRPISGIESRLEHLENQFTLITKDLQSFQARLNEPCSHAADEVERTQDPVSLDDSVADCMAGCQNVGTKTSSGGTTFRAPECMSEDESDDDGHCSDDDGHCSDDDSHCSDDETIHKEMEVKYFVPNIRKPISIDGALASALAAFAIESSPNVSTVRSDKVKDPDLIKERDAGGFVPSGSPLCGDGVPLVSIDEVKIKVASDLLSSIEGLTPSCRDYNEAGEGTTNLDENIHQVDGRDITSDVAPKEGTLEDSDAPAARVATQSDISQNICEDMHHVNGSITNKVGPVEGIMQDSDIQSHTGPVLFSKSVIGETSDEEEVEESFTPDSPRFACNSPLSSSDLEPSYPNYGGILEGWGNDSSSSSTASSFDEGFLKTKTQINLSDDITTVSSTFSESSQKVSETWDESRVLDPLAVLLGEMTDMHGSVSVTATKEDTPSTNGPFFDMEGILNSSEVSPADSNMPRFESLI